MGYKRRKTPGNTDWFVNDRFGMFIHFGLYSLTARHEWIKTIEKIPDEKYDKYFKYFNPDKFDAKEWARKAKAAGMKYAVLTTKHHEGFCLFDSEYTDYKITNTPFGRDLVKEYVEAFRAEGLKIGFYYSVIDWHHPDYQIDAIHPKRALPGAQEMNKTRDMTKYCEYLHNQVRELMTNYGKIDILWFDFTYPDYSILDNEFNQPVLRDFQDWMPYTTAETWKADELIKMVRDINPEIIINDRLDIPQDIITPEQTHTPGWPEYPDTKEKKTWESCQTFSGAWGYSRDEMSWKTPETLLQMLISIVATGGNLIMNVGPTGRGNFDKRADAALEVFGEWMSANSRSIYGCTMADPEFCAPTGSLITQSDDGKRLYIHILNYPYADLIMKDMAGKIDYCQLLHDASEILFKENEDGSVTFKLPGLKPTGYIPVIEVFLK